MYGAIICACTTSIQNAEVHSTGRSVELLNVKFGCTCSNTVGASGVIYSAASVGHISGAFPKPRAVAVAQ